MSASTPPPSGAPPEQLAGRLLAGRYRLNRPIASGGMARVWEATDETLARRVAVKLLHDHLARDESFVHRFRAEAVAAARLSHPAIISVYDTFSVDGLEGIVMELVVGTTMRADLDQHGPMRLEAALAIGTQVADALGAAHASGLVHRDVKPANILLASDGRVLVADFGIAKAVEGQDLTGTGTMIGTAKYLAPEQVQGAPVDGRADLYALGVVLYEALAGQPPFAADTDAATALARLQHDPAPLRSHRAEVPPAVEAVVLQALARRPEARFASAAAMGRALRSAASTPTAPAPGAAPSPPAAPSRPATAAPAVPPPPPAPVRTPTPPPPRPVAPPPPPSNRPLRDPEGPPTDEAPPGRRRRRWPAVAVVVVAACVAAVAIAAQTGDPDGGAELELVAATSFDPPPGDGVEKDELLADAIDGDPATAWRSEAYDDPVALAGGKDGFGLVAELATASDVRQVAVDTPEGGWSARVYASDAPGDDLGSWGEPLASVSEAEAGTTRFAVEAEDVTHVMVWFTQAAPSGVVAVSEMTVRGT